MSQKDELLLSQDMTSVTTASTGTAATLVDGTTLHNALALPRQTNLKVDNYKLGNKKRQMLQNKYTNLVAIIVDEVSQSLSI